MTSMQKPTQFDFTTQYGLPLDDTDDAIIVDLFAGGGGASTGLELGLGRQVALAINHNPAAISMHMANHPHAKHYQTDVWGVDPVESTGGKVVGWLHASPDCRHHSQAAGGQPRSKEIRDLSWVVLKWAGKLRRLGKGPWVISLENVKQILQWGRLIAKRDRATGRVVRRDGSVAAPGEQVPRQEQFLVPDPKHKGRTWQRFVHSLEQLGYQVDYWVERNCDYGDPTSRQRLYMVATADDYEPASPERSHAAKPAKGQAPYRTAAECIDWSDLGQSIRNRKRPLAEATMRRIAKGIKKEVMQRARPFIVPIANWSREAVQPVDAPLNTITAWPKGGSFALASPVLVSAAHGEGKPDGVKRWGKGYRSLGEPLPTVTASGRGGQSIATAFLAQANAGYNTTHSKPADAPISTITNRGSQQQLVTANLVTLRKGSHSAPADEPLGTQTTSDHHGLVAAHLLHLRGNCDARAADEPLQTVSAGGQHHGLVTADLVADCLTPEQVEGAVWVAAFLMKYHGMGENIRPLDEPVSTVTTKDRLALVTVWISGDPCVIVDIRLRMLKPRELYRAQGFPESYIIDRGHDGKPFTLTQQVHMCGNSVSPGTMAAIARANDPWKARLRCMVAA